MLGPSAGAKAGWRAGRAPSRDAGCLRRKTMMPADRTVPAASSGGLLLLPSSARWLRLSGRLASLVTRPNAEPWHGWEGQTQGDGFNTLACV